MSHVVALKVKINNLPALVAAANELGGIFVKDKKEYGWFGTHVGDYPLPEGFTKEDLGKCSHVIALPGGKYEVGVVQLADGSYTLLHDFYGREGKKLEAAFGVGLKKLTQLYSVHRADLLARSKGYKTQRIAGSNGSIKLQVTGGSL